MTNEQDGMRLATAGPFHLEATVRLLQRRPANRVDIWESRGYRRVLESAEGGALIEVVNRGSVDAPDLRLRLPAGKLAAENRQALALAVRKVLGLDVAPAPLARLGEAEPHLRAAARALRGMRPPRFPGLFEAFANVVPFQQLSLDAGAAIVGRLVALLGSKLDHGGRRFAAFPGSRDVAQTTLEDLMACGLSRAKARSLRAIAELIEAGELTEQEIEAMSTAAALARLAELPGIGPWSAGLVLLRGFGRLDVFPPGDVGAVRALTGLLRLTPQRLADVVECWGEYRGYLYFFGLGEDLLRRGLIEAADG